MILAAYGLGCNHCEVGVPITFVSAPSGVVSLCLECTLFWFPQWSVSDWEERHSPYRNHLDDKLAEAIRREMAP